MDETGYDHEEPFDEPGGYAEEVDDAAGDATGGYQPGGYEVGGYEVGGYEVGGYEVGLDDAGSDDQGPEDGSDDPGTGEVDSDAPGQAGAGAEELDLADPPTGGAGASAPDPGLSDGYPDEPLAPVADQPDSTLPAMSTTHDVDTMTFGAEVDGPGEPAPGAEVSALSVFPPALPDVALPPPVDGLPWVDGTLLGGPEAESSSTAAPAGQQDLLTDLRSDAGEPGAGWDALRSSDDPAVRALSELWSSAVSGVDSR